MTSHYYDDPKTYRLFYLTFGCTHSNHTDTEMDAADDIAKVTENLNLPFCAHIERLMNTLYRAGVWEFAIVRHDKFKSSDRDTNCNEMLDAHYHLLVRHKYPIQEFSLDQRLKEILVYLFNGNETTLHFKMFNVSNVGMTFNEKFMDATTNEIKLHGETIKKIQMGSSIKNLNGARNILNLIWEYHVPITSNLATMTEHEKYLVNRLLTFEKGQSYFKDCLVDYLDACDHGYGCFQSIRHNQQLTVTLDSTLSQCRCSECEEAFA